MAAIPTWPDVGEHGLHIVGETRIRQCRAGEQPECLAQRPSASRGRRVGCGVVWMHDDESWPFVVHDDHPLMAGDGLTGMPGNPYLLRLNRDHGSMTTPEA
jgi:hypothetical protein